MPDTLYAEVALNRPLFQPFSYHIPPHLNGLIEVGQMVKVPFRTAFEAGIVLSLTDQKPGFSTKPIQDRLDPLPVVTPIQMALAAWLARETHAPIGFCLWLMLPPGITQKSDFRYTLLDENVEGKTPTEKQVISLFKRRGSRTGQQFGQAFGNKGTWRKVIKTLVEQGVINADPTLAPPGVKPKVIRTALLTIDPRQIPRIATELGRESKRANVLEVLWRHPQHIAPIQEVLEAAGCGRSVIKTLASSGEITINNDLVQLEIDDTQVRNRILELRGAAPYLAILEFLRGGAADVSSIYTQTGTDLKHLEKLHDDGLIALGDSEIWRDPLADRFFQPTTFPPLTSDQAEVWARIHEVGEGVFLLHGVTGSGKTEIYMQAVAETLAQGRQAIVMVPEIALTTQMVQRFAARFPDQIGIVHGTLSSGERYDTWRRAREGLFQIVIGARSALFTPFPDVGLIILDEEHDDSYKQSPPIQAPYYHARETAIEYMRLNGGTVILGSATPDVISYYKAQQGAYELLHLPDRILAHRQAIENQAHQLNIEQAHYRPLENSEAAYSALPPVQIVDMRQELRVGHISVFSRALIAALHETLALDQQAILFLNRRGSATYILCRDCGYIAICSRCETPLTFHQQNALLICHHCGHKEPNPTTCPQCSGQRIKYFGRGTEQIEKILKQEFSQARVLRWDQDTASRKGAHEEIYQTFAERRADILVGTQMITKGLDLPLVTLVGIVSGDTALGLPDYRTNENTFQLLTQVAGRAGRGLLGGRVILQTYQPDHYAIQAAAQHDYHTFYRREIEYRKNLRYPPFTRLARVLFRNRIDSEAQREGETLAKKLAKNLPPEAEMIGPVPCFFTKIDDEYRWHLLIRAHDPAALFIDFEPSHGCTLDIDPVNIL